MKHLTYFYILSILFSMIVTNAEAEKNLFIDFKKPGKPNTKGITWKIRDEMLPVKDWETIVPGNGYAYLTIDADKSNNKKKDGRKIKFPFQMITLSPIKPGCRLEMRAKGTVIPGVATFIFTYNEGKNKFDEIDIEIVGNDGNLYKKPHATDPENGWTDVRLNAWEQASVKTLKPEVSFKQPIVDKKGKKVSHDDGKFHIYTIDWYKNKIDFFIDGVYQKTISKLSPKNPTVVNVGMRHMAWTGKLNWTGTRSMVIDWIRIKYFK